MLPLCYFDPPEFAQGGGLGNFSEHFHTNQEPMSPEGFPTNRFLVCLDSKRGGVVCLLINHFLWEASCFPVISHREGAALLEIKINYVRVNSHLSANYVLINC